MIISIHIPKNAGNSFISTLKDLYGKNLQFDYKDKIASPKYLQRKFESYPKIKRNSEIIHGHFQAGKYLKKYPKAKFIAWFREPVERIASIYYFWKRKPDMQNPTCVKMLKKDYSLLEFAKMPEIKDMQSYMIQPLKLRDFMFIGITEHYYKSMNLFKKTMGTNKQLHHYHHNINPDKEADRYAIGKNLRMKIKIINAKDVILYKRARYIFFLNYAKSKFGRISNY